MNGIDFVAGGGTVFLSFTGGGAGTDAPGMDVRMMIATRAWMACSSPAATTCCGGEGWGVSLSHGPNLPDSLRRLFSWCWRFVWHSLRGCSMWGWRPALGFARIGPGRGAQLTKFRQLLCWHSPRIRHLRTLSPRRCCGDSPAANLQSRQVGGGSHWTILVHPVAGSRCFARSGIAGVMRGASL